jgi:hypothetical protein
MLDAPEGTVAGWIAAARHQLRDLLGEEAQP